MSTKDGFTAYSRGYEQGEKDLKQNKKSTFYIVDGKIMKRAGNGSESIVAEGTDRVQGYIDGYYGAPRKEKKMAAETRMKIAYVITKTGAKQYWNRIGVGFLNRDGSINVTLSALPVDGKFQLRDYIHHEDEPTPPVDPRTEPF